MSDSSPVRPGAMFSPGLSHCPRVRRRLVSSGEAATCRGAPRHSYALSRPLEHVESRTVMSRLVHTAWVSAVLTAFAGARAQTSAFTLTSTDVHQGQKIASAQVFNGMGCTGNNSSPALEWRGAPAKTKSFAITAYDPDAPTGSGWWHWVVYNIPATATKLAAGGGRATKQH